MKKVLGIIFLAALFVTGITAHKVDWKQRFSDRQLHDYFGYDTQYDHDNYSDRDYYANDYRGRYYNNSYDRNNYKNRSITIFDTTTTAHSAKVFVKNLNLRGNERYTLSCRSLNDSIYNSTIAKNYDDSDLYNYNYNRVLTINDLQAETEYKCTVSIEEEYKPYFWRLSATPKHVNITTKEANTDYNLNTIAGRRASYAASAKTNSRGRLNDPKRWKSDDISTVVAVHPVVRRAGTKKKTSKKALVGPRYYQYTVLKNWLSVDDLSKLEVR